MCVDGSESLAAVPRTHERYLGIAEALPYVLVPCQTSYLVQARETLEPVGRVYPPWSDALSFFTARPAWKAVCECQRPRHTRACVKLVGQGERSSDAMVELLASWLVSGIGVNERTHADSFVR